MKQGNDLSNFTLFQWQSWVEKYREFINPNYLDDKSAANEISSTKLQSLPHCSSTETESLGTSEHWNVLWESHIQEQYVHYLFIFSISYSYFLLVLYSSMRCLIYRYDLLEWHIVSKLTNDRKDLISLLNSIF